MVEQTSKGNKVMKYLIEGENKSKQLRLPNFTNLAEAAIAWAK